MLEDTQYWQAWSIIWRNQIFLSCDYSLRSMAKVLLNVLTNGNPTNGCGIFVFYINFTFIIQICNKWQKFCNFNASVFFNKAINWLLVGSENYLCSFTTIYCFSNALSSNIFLQKKAAFDLQAFSLMNLLFSFIQ